MKCYETLLAPVAAILLASSHQVGGQTGADPIAIWEYSGGTYESTFQRAREDVDGACGDDLIHMGKVGGRLIEHADGTFFLEGYDCTLSIVERGQGPVECESNLQESLDTPLITVDEFTLSDGNLVLDGEMEKADFRYCFRLRSTAQRKKTSN